MARPVGRPPMPEGAKVCTLCGDPRRSSATWCAKCWRIYQAARRAGKNTVLVIRELKARALAKKNAA